MKDKRTSLIEENYQYLLKLINRVRFLLLVIVIIFALFKLLLPFLISTLFLGLTFAPEKSELRKIVETRVDKEIEKYL